MPKLLEMNGDGKLNVALSDDPMYAKVRKINSNIEVLYRLEVAL